MATRVPNVVNDTYAQFDAAFKAARVPTELYEGLGDIWVENPGRAHALIRRFKDTGDLPLRQKAAPAGDEFDQLGQQIADAARQMAMQSGGDRKTIIDQLRSYAMQLATPQRATKAAAPAPGSGEHMKALISGALDAAARNGGIH